MSRATVARALSGKGYVDKQKREVIENAAKQLGYRTSAIARALRTQRSRSIGVLVADITNPIFPQIVKGIDDVLSAEGHIIFLCNTDENTAKQFKLASSLIDRNVDGLILVSQNLESEGFRNLLAGGPPCIYVNRRPLEGEYDYVGSDNEQAIEFLVEHLVGLGHRQIGFIAGSANSSTARERREFYHRALERRGITMEDNFVFQGDYTIEGGRRAFVEMMQRGPALTAVMASNDFSALGFIDAAQAFGLTVPGDISVTGFDDTAGVNSFMKYPLPIKGLTTIYQSKREIGIHAANMMLRRLDGSAGTAPQVAIVPTNLRARDTTGEVRLVRKKSAVQRQN
ncbi:LacI family transcriptional regulator [Devosia sp. 2618]